MIVSEAELPIAPAGFDETDLPRVSDGTSLRIVTPSPSCGGKMASGRFCLFDVFWVVEGVTVGCVVEVVVVVVVLPAVGENRSGTPGVDEARGVLKVTAGLELCGGSTTKVFLLLPSCTESTSARCSSGECWWSSSAFLSSFSLWTSASAANSPSKKLVKDNCGSSDSGSSRESSGSPAGVGVTARTCDGVAEA